MIVKDESGNVVKNVLNFEDEGSNSKKRKATPKRAAKSKRRVSDSASNQRMSLLFYLFGVY